MKCFINLSWKITITTLPWLLICCWHIGKISTTFSNSAKTIVLFISRNFDIVIKCQSILVITTFNFILRCIPLSPYLVSDCITHSEWSSRLLERKSQRKIKACMSLLKKNVEFETLPKYPPSWSVHAYEGPYSDVYLNELTPIT